MQSEINCADPGALGLVVEFFAAEHLAKCYSRLLEPKRDPELQIAEQRIPVDAVAVDVGIAVEKYVVRDGARLEAGEQAPVVAALPVERRQPGKTGLDRRRADVVLQMDSPGAA